MESKKISFGFKISAKPNILPIKQLNGEPKAVKELIKCLEGHEIKLVKDKTEEAPLIIPMATHHKTSAALASLRKRRAVLLGEDEVIEAKFAEQSKFLETAAAGEELEIRAARELLTESQMRGKSLEQPQQLVLPLLKPDELPLDGAQQSTLDDYDSIPVQQFGLAMLRGMGWVEAPRKEGEYPANNTPFVRPKGMGLGADKALKAKNLLVQPEANELLEIRKLAFVRILGGKHKNLYGQIKGFDDNSGRVIVKMAIGGAKEVFNEFLCQPVSKKEYAQYAKCINTVKYEQFKRMENEYRQIMVNEKKGDYEQRSIKNENPLDMQHKCKNTKKYIKNELEKKINEDESKSYADIKLREYNSYKNETNNYNSLRDERAQSSNCSKRSQADKQHRSKQCSHTSTCNKPYINSSDSNNRHLHSAAEETDESSDSIDTDSAYERKYKKSSKKSIKSKCKSGYTHRRRNSNSITIVNSNDESNDFSTNKRQKSKHKKTKKSKHARSRSRSRR